MTGGVTTLDNDEFRLQRYILPLECSRSNRALCSSSMYFTASSMTVTWNPIPKSWVQSTLIYRKISAKLTWQIQLFCIYYIIHCRFTSLHYFTVLIVANTKIAEIRILYNNTSYRSSSKYGGGLILSTQIYGYQWVTIEICTFQAFLMYRHGSVYYFFSIRLKAIKVEPRHYYILFYHCGVRIAFDKHLQFLFTTSALNGLPFFLLDVLFSLTWHESFHLCQQILLSHVNTFPMTSTLHTWRHCRNVQDEQLFNVRTFTGQSG